MTVLEQVLDPRGLPFVGNLFDLADDEAHIRAFERLARLYGPIYKLQRPKGKMLVVSSVAMVEELCDETRFVKMPPSALAEEAGSKRPAGLFGAKNEDPDLGQAHRILMPAFGQLVIESCFDDEFSREVDVGLRLWLMTWCRDEGYWGSALSQMGANGSNTYCYDRRFYATDFGYNIVVYDGLSLQFSLHRNRSSFCRHHGKVLVGSRQQSQSFDGDEQTQEKGSGEV